MTAVYKTGQITLANGSAVVTGVGTAWATMLIAGGIIFPVVGGNPLAIQSVVSNTSITAEKPWAGVSGTYDYVLVRWSADEEQNSINSSILATVYAELQAGTIWKYDIAGPAADKATYNERPKGFSYLIIDANPAQLFIKASAAAGDWAGPFAYATGPEGPPGPAGYVNYRGAYSAVTAYAKNDGVLSGGSTYVALQATTGNAPPTYPTTSTAYWQLTALKGTDGTGTGDVVGPAGSTDDTVAFFDGTTGKLLKFKTKSAFKTWLALSAAETSFDNSSANLAGAPANVQAAINALAAGTGGGKNDALLALEIADLKGQRMGMVGGVADSFDDETGILTKTNATYDAANDYYSPTSTIDQTAAPATNTTAGVSTYTIFNYNLPVTNGKTINSFVFSQTVAGSYTFKIAQRTAAGAYTVVYSQVITHGGGGAQTFAMTTPYAVPATGSYCLGMYTAISTAVAMVVASGGRAFKAVDAPLGAQTGYTEDTAQAYSVGAIYSITTDNMTLVSVAYPATSVPTTARIALQTVESTALTPNTDFTMEVSRDGGTTYTAATLALSASFGGVKIYEASVSVAGQPSGSSMKWRAKSLTNKNVVMSGVVLQQS